jgi:hypothetical protein
MAEKPSEMRYLSQSHLGNSLRDDDLSARKEFFAEPAILALIGPTHEVASPPFGPVAT